ncbi:protocatechuate 3,4-dioxygenase [Burkholderia multivorans]|uniref:DODA-type extradiol aromatic ring-opening family dioxygenase n=1 Tax=Burkholderia multivorans TaxID=87883 RepID=UPI0009E0D099|nr:protocatechuate 3,4-dioxygenase [Burkholderia multivorans]MCA8500158.1 protocatechuate 3,4-dioxygenase [Burkholderia multivorans]MDN8078235.1 protocatechuate 3,4-dioxygenase [Burkholderia multivorans]SAJ91071.1 catalytic LigB subunit of aromatic ring-opening dioxygenase family protein [Burkholderia multivorans]SAJ91168.1 catalytic LigB subunit of aromatic ring-opening dioxygenase family protein [Burkholderia multivorans]
MAKIVFGMAVPHSGMLGQAPEDWLKNGERDRANPELWFRNRTWTYPELEAHRGAAFEPYLTLEERRARAARCRAALDAMAAAYRDARIDVAIILGKDQKEIFTHQSPSIAIYSGAEVHNGPPQRAVYAPDRHVTHRCHPQLAAWLIERFQREGFDLTDLFAWPDNVWMKPLPDYPVVPHAYSFVYHQIMSDDPPPHVPVLMNCFYPPTQPSMSRCIAFGDVLRDALNAWPEDVRIGIFASGGLSHFVNDEEFDHRILKMLADYDYDGLAAIDNRAYQSGTSEIKLYASVMKAMEKAGAPMTLVDYVPCWRTPAGTGEGMGFMYWRAAD